MCRLFPRLLALAFLFAPLLQAQADDPLAMAEEALAGGEYRQAERTLRSFVDARKDAAAGTSEADRAAAAYYLLSRLYTEQPAPDTDRAEGALADALQYDPDNPTYLTAELVALRAATWNFVLEKARERRRRELATRLLAVDSTNAFAHEELGTQAIRDFWFYRNAIALPDFRLARPLRGVQSEDIDGVDTAPITDEAVDSPNIAPEGLTAANELYTSDSPGDFLDVDDPFNVDRLTSQGAAVLAFTQRADRAYENAIGHLEAALRYDARRRPVYERMMELYALSERYDEALPMLQQMFVHFPEDEEMWRFLGLANLRVGNHAGAAKSFAEALERMTPEQRAAFEDLSLILPASETEAYRADPEGYRSRYWTSRNPRFLTPYNERKIEHYARLTYADLLYESDNLGLPGWAVERGKILVRYGPPPKDVTIVGDFEQALHAFGFATMQQENERGYNQSFDLAAAANVFNVWDYGDFKFVFEDPFRNGEFSLYSPPADVFADVSARFTDNVDFVIQARETFRERPETYGYEAPGRQVQLPYLTTAFRGDEGRTDLYVHYGVPVTAPDDEAALQGLTVRTGTFLVGEDRDLLVERRRTLYGLNPQQVVRFRETALWVDTQRMPTTPGDHELSVEFETVSGQTMAVQRRAVGRAGLRGGRAVAVGPAARLPGGGRAGGRRAAWRDRAARLRDPTCTVGRLFDRAARLPLLRGLRPHSGQRPLRLRRRGSARAQRSAGPARQSLWRRVRGRPRRRRLRRVSRSRGISRRRPVRDSRRDGPRHGPLHAPPPRPRPGHGQGRRLRAGVVSRIGVLVD